MSAKPLICLGDATDHGGVVISASSMLSVNGKAVACVGDKVQCPIKGHGVCDIIEGDPLLVIDGKQVARDGHKTACGAALIASQSNASVG